MLRCNTHSRHQSTIGVVHDPRHGRREFLPKHQAVSRYDQCNYPCYERCHRTRTSPSLAYHDPRLSFGFEGRDGTPTLRGFRLAQRDTTSVSRIDSVSIAWVYKAAKGVCISGAGGIAGTNSGEGRSALRRSEVNELKRRPLPLGEGGAKRKRDSARLKRRAKPQEKVRVSRFDRHRDWSQPVAYLN